MGYIYKITNKVNGKSYIGKTERTIQRRFQEHCHEAYEERSYDRPLYRAIRKYGKENFEVTELEQTDQAEEREIYWINFYKTYGANGYNATKGGEGKKHYNHEEILKALQEYPYPKQIAERFGCCPDIVRDIARNNNIEMQNPGKEAIEQNKKEVEQYSLKGEFIQSFSSTAEAGLWCFKNDKTSVYSSGVRGHIAEVANGKRKTAYGYIWKYK